MNDICPLCGYEQTDGGFIHTCLPPEKQPLNVVAIFVAKDSIYKSLGLDCYDEARGAKTYTGIAEAMADQWTLATRPNEKS